MVFRVFDCSTGEQLRRFLDTLAADSAGRLDFSKAALSCSVSTSSIGSAGARVV